MLPLMSLGAFEWIRGATKPPQRRMAGNILGYGQNASGTSRLPRRAWLASRRNMGGAARNMVPLLAFRRVSGVARVATLLR